MTLRVLHCPWMVGGNPAGLAAAERELGIESTTMAFRPSPYGYPIDEVVWDDGDGRIVGELKRWRLLPRILRDFDVVHFNFGSTVAPQRTAPDEPGAKPRNVAERTYSAALEQFDLQLLARAGKAIFVTFQGDDARQSEATLRFPVSGSSELSPGYYSPHSDANKRRRVVRFDRYADGIYALNPDLLRFLPGRARFMPYAHVDLREWKAGAPAGTGGRLRVLHAPTHQGIKGTRFVLDAVSRLRSEGVEFEFELADGLTQAELRVRYGLADLVVDQLLVGWYGGLAVEAMALERPVVGFLGDDELSALPAAMRAEIPIVPARPDTVHQVLKELLTVRRAELGELGKRGRDYVGRWHDPIRIAEQLIADYQAAVEAHRR